MTMSRAEHLLIITAEECNEVAHRISKALRFSPYEIQPGQKYTNARRIMDEFYQLRLMILMLIEEGILYALDDDIVLIIEKSKREKVERFLKLSESVGTLNKG